MPVELQFLIFSYKRQDIGERSLIYQVTIPAPVIMNSAGNVIDLFYDFLRRIHFHKNMFLEACFFSALLIFLI